jgi:hypothetical protein
MRISAPSAAANTALLDKKQQVRYGLATTANILLLKPLSLSK